MRKIKILEILIIYYILIFINDGNKVFIKSNFISKSPRYKCFANYRNKYLNFMIRTNYTTKKKINIYENPLYYKKKKKHILKGNKSITRRLFTLQPNKISSKSGLEPSKSVLKHIKKKYNLGNSNYRIQKELNNFLKNPPINCTIDVHPNNIRVWIVQYVGLENTIYANEVYKIKIIFSNDYPLKPPTVYFLQKPPKHTHVYSNGDICLSLLGDDYNPSLSISGLILSIISMLSSAKEKKLPIDNYTHADAKPGSSQNNFLYHDDKC
ncbi:ubiquitin-conjugating enzyme E2, putative [Plasmodium relictum]|uniref:Ubiquitin-conjugating enzyme E2, putative n=1 Tax=Plasmodium relictum TaxID=85471 RepID=A0A1J1H9L7_PLARL|nr:ubiquitin-conjugating enzyme E2, putative [Plasmodium relictum]CRH01637.1 ubiquitin-conjugating enzyme E2, putative [Plasmodium relictum]